MRKNDCGGFEMRVDISKVEKHVMFYIRTSQFENFIS